MINIHILFVGGVTGVVETGSDEAGAAESASSSSSIMPHSSLESTNESERTSSSSDSDFPRVLDIAIDKSESPVQPKICFPSRVFGSSGCRSFQVHWYKEFPWIEYSVEKDAVFCFPCRFFNTVADKAFTRTGFRDWKHATGKHGILTCHDSKCATHKGSVVAWKQFKLTIANDASIGVHLDRQGKKIIEDNRQYVKALLESLLFCAQQGIALRGHRESMEDSSTNPGNFRSLVSLMSRHNDVLRRRLDEGPRNASWLGHHIQNELIQIMADMVLSSITAEVKDSCYFTLIADETKDVSKREQLSIVLRYVYKGIVHERFLAFVHAHHLDASSLSEYIIKTLSDLHINIEFCVSQCYDGASVMSGQCAGVSAKIKEKNNKAVYVHCCAHRLNLVLVDATKQLPSAADFFSLLEALYVFMSSSKAHDLFLAKQTELGQHREVRLKKLSDTRWSCRYASIKALTSTFAPTLATLKEISEGDDQNRIVEARGILLQVRNFEFVLCLIMFERIFAITSKLSDVLQAECLDFTGAVTCIEATIETLQDMRSEEWRRIWERAVSLASTHSITIEYPRSRRSRQLPERLRDMVTTAETDVGN